MSRVDQQMQASYQQLKQTHTSGQKFTEKETRQLIIKANKYNNDAKSSSSCRSSKKPGTKALNNIYIKHKTEFSDTAPLLQNFLSQGKIPKAQSQTMAQQGQRRNISNDFHHEGRRHTLGSSSSSSSSLSSSSNLNYPPDPSGLSSSSSHSSISLSSSSSGSTRVHENSGYISARSSSHMVHSLSRSSLGDLHENLGITNRGSSFGLSSNLNNSASGPITGAVTNTNGPDRVSEVETTTGVRGDTGFDEINWQASKPGWNAFWWPTKADRDYPEGHPALNLWAPNGALHKHDMCTGRSARDYEMQTFSRAADAGSQFNWEGNCDKATLASCLVEAPKHDVKRTNIKTGEEVIWTTRDIEGYGVRVWSSLVDKVDWKGDRYNVSSDPVGDPSPAEFLQVMQDWTKGDIPFGMDIDPEEPVWNYCYDQVKIQVLDTPPKLFDASILPNDQATKYYDCHASGTGFPEQKRHYQFWIRPGQNGEKDESGWIITQTTPDGQELSPDSPHYTHKNPDFLWRPHPKENFMNRPELWQGDLAKNSEGNSNGMEKYRVDGEFFYHLYKDSIA